MVNAFSFLILTTFFLTPQYARAQEIQKVKYLDVVCALGWKNCGTVKALKNEDLKSEDNDESVIETASITEVTPEQQKENLDTVLVEIAKVPAWQKAIHQKVSKMQPFCLSDIVLANANIKPQGVDLISKYGNISWKDAKCAEKEEIAKTQGPGTLKVGSGTGSSSSASGAKKLDCNVEPNKSHNCSCLATALIHYKKEWREQFKCLDKGGEFKLTDVITGWSDVKKTDLSFKVIVDRFMARKCEPANGYIYTGRAPKGSPKAVCPVKTQ